MPVSNIFVNLPVADLERSRTFWRAVGFEFNEQFTDENATCLVLGDNIYAMLLLPEFFSTFTTRRVASGDTIEALLATSVESREAVDAMVEAAVAAGGIEPRQSQDHGFMYTRAFDDPDGHSWEVLWMDPDHVE